MRQLNLRIRPLQEKTHYNILTILSEEKVFFSDTLSKAPAGLLRSRSSSLSSPIRWRTGPFALREGLLKHFLLTQYGKFQYSVFSCINHDDYDVVCKKVGGTYRF